MLTAIEYGPVLDYCVEKTRQNIERLAAFPHTTRNGRWRTSDHGRWTAGHWLGIIWLAYLRSSDPFFRDAAYTWAKRLEPRKHDTSTHDMGFLFGLSFMRGYLITGDPYFRDVALTAARSMATRYHPLGNYIEAWSVAEDPSHQGRTIVDTVMNLPFLLWAAAESSEPQLRGIALRVAEMTAHHHVRPDGSTYHVVDFDSATGKAIRFTTHQGLHDNSYWTRGQAWAMYGFATMARMTDRQDLRAVANKVADFFIEKMEPDQPPPWDFAASGSDQPKDASAGAIAMDGLLDLALSARDPQERSAREAQARELLDTLITTCVDPRASEQEGLLLHATADRPRNSAVDESLIYGDHYFFEALFRAVDPDTVTPYL
jgi:unsaturated chondroitin disaccharide hydrolase